MLAADGKLIALIVDGFFDVLQVGFTPALAAFYGLSLALFGVFSQIDQRAYCRLVILLACR